MWRRRIKEFIFEKKDPSDNKPMMNIFTIDDQFMAPFMWVGDSCQINNCVHMKEHYINISQAVAHYCAECKRGFKTIGATGAHKRLKHGK